MTVAPPDDATKLSDKNRDVAEETRATQTNLDHESEGQAVASRESDDHQSAEVGGPDDRIRQLEEAQATTDQHIRETDHSGRAETAKGALRGLRDKLDLFAGGGDLIRFGRHFSILSRIVRKEQQNEGKR